MGDGDGSFIVLTKKKDRKDLSRVVRTKCAKWVYAENNDPGEVMFLGVWFFVGVFCCHCKFKVYR